MDSGQQGRQPGQGRGRSQRGAGRATAASVRQGGRKPGESLAQTQQPSDSVWDKSQRQAPMQQPQGQSGWPHPSGSSGPRPTGPPPFLGRAEKHQARQEHPRPREQPKPQEQPRQETLKEPSRAAAAVGDTARGAIRGKRVINEIVKSKPVGLLTKKGKSGIQVGIQANYFRCLKKPEWSIYQYRVDFSPDIDMFRIRKALLREHRDHFGGYLFDGSMLFATKKLAQEKLDLVSKDRNEELVKITVKYVAQIMMTDGQSIQVLNLILRGAMDGLQLQLVGRNFFDAAAKISIPNFRVELWPGYTTSIRQHEQDILLCAEIAHKVMRNERVYDILQKCIQESRNYQDAFRQKIIGMVVLTDYNNKTYRVDDIDFEQNPSSTFPTRDGNISYQNYYTKKYNLKITDAKQPLLVSRSRERDLRAGQSEFVMLIPELCRATGLSEEMRNNFQTMKALAEHTRLNPSARIERLKAFNRRLYATKPSMEHLAAWNLNLDKNLVEFSGRILSPEAIVFGGGKRVSAGEQADWTREFRNVSMFNAVELTRWFVLVPSRNQNETTEFVKCIRRVAGGMRMNIADPKIVPLQDDRNNSYVMALEKCCAMDPQLIMAIVPNNNAERYSCIKKKTCVDRAVPSQVIVQRTIAPRQGKPPSGLMSVATKVAIQMNCKLAGSPWMVELPISGLMTVGFDVCHSAREPSRSYGALVATMDIRKSSRFFSSVTVHNKGQELSNEIAADMTKALRQYRETHGTLPARICFFRDGVGEGQLHQVFETEVVILKKRLDEIYAQANVPGGCKLVFIVVSKRINTRLFINGQNPPPGTVVDDVITLPERYDFFLVSQSVRQGTVSPTSYHIIHDSLGLDADKLQMLTYKMCHMYYNWSGTTRVPALCQYAHKLAFLVAQYLHQSPSALLEKQLYFL